MFSISRFHALMEGVDRGGFDALVRHHASDKHCKKFGSWKQLVAMVYAQLSGANSLRTVVCGYNHQQAHHYHLGTGPLSRSTLAEANAKRSPAVFDALARQLMAQSHRRVRREAERALYVLDSTSITLKGPGFDDWTFANRNPRTQGVKLHVLFNTAGHMPCAQSITAANVNDIEQAVDLPIETGGIYVFDKGYCHYGWWAQIDAAGAQFVTRFKANAGLRVERELPVPSHSPILSDALVRLTLSHSGKRRLTYTQTLRRVTVSMPDRPRPLILATNDLTSPAEVIAQRYKDRWQVELFFKWIKQHLNIGRYLGRSENAVRIQILCALVSYLLLARYRDLQASTKSLWHFFSEFAASLFERSRTEAHYRQRQRERRAETARRQPGLFA